MIHVVVALSANRRATGLVAAAECWDKRSSISRTGGRRGRRRQEGGREECRMSLLFLLAFFCRAEHTVQDEMQQCSGSSVLFDEDLLCHVVAIHTISATRPTSSDITLVTMKMVVGLITMMTNVTFK